MKDRLKLFFTYMLYWVSIFIIYKILFIIYHFEKTADLSGFDIAKIFIYGFRMDVAMAGYFMLVVGLLIIIFFRSNKSLNISLSILTGLLLLITSLLVVIDMELYRIWGFRLDATPILYVTTNAAGATALGDNWVVARQILIWFVLIGAGWWSYRKFIAFQIGNLKTEKWFWAPVLLLLTGSMILPIRGSLGMTPMNSGFVYFHQTNLFANHAALNLLWNAGKSLTRMNELITPSDFFDQEKSKTLWNELYESNTGKTFKLLNTNRPNVILLVLENFTSKFIESLGGKKGVTPTLARLIHDGVLFDHFYANGDRTERGILSVLSAYPPHPTSSITKFPNKTQNMGYISQELNKVGYSSGYICGYDLAYANFRSYFSNAGFNKISSEIDFDKEIPRTKWGVDDHHVFKKWITDINEMKPPFFTMHHTLSSHHPFEVPMETVIEGDDEESRFMNSAFYTDKSLGEFIEAAKQMEWWDKTLLIITADHGNSMPSDVFNTPDRNFKIPMIWYGGALAKKDTIISTYGSQNDIAQTLLSQLDLKNNKLKFSRDLLAEKSKSFAFYTFNNGFGFANDSSILMYDNVSNKYINMTGKCSPKEQNQGKACMQMLYNDLEAL